jgi:alpha-glucosidase
MKWKVSSVRMRSLLLAVTTLLLVSTACAQQAPVQLRSPDRRLNVSITNVDGMLRYEVAVEGKTELLSSRLGLGPDWDHGVHLGEAVRSTRDVKWKPLYGERDEVRDRYNQVSLELKRQGQPALKLEVRAYNEGVAFHYVAITAITIRSDHSEFRWPEGTEGYEEHGGTEGEYHRAPIAEIAPLCQAPLTLALADGSYAAILEAASVNFPVMTLGAEPDHPDTLEAEIAGTASISAGEATPWRVVMFARTPGELLEHNGLQLNLNAPQALHDVAWIKPGTAIRETSLTTDGAKKLIDFAGHHEISYIGFDDHWYGVEDAAHGDATHERTHDDSGRPTPPLSIAQVAAYGKQHGVGLVIYVDRRQARKQRDVLFPLYERWGVAGVKLGFVDVGTQEDIAWITETVRKAAEHHLVLDIHDQYRGTGYTRTYPNLLTVEGVRGNEHFPTAEHNATLPFTRFLVGAADVTICYMDKRLVNTHAHQMAMSVIAFSPMQWIFWYDSPASFHNEPDLSWFDHLPTVWNETRVPSGEIGKFAVIARRSGDRWYVGAITNGDARALPVVLDFLKPALTYEATIYRDDPSVPTDTHIAVEHRTVRKGIKLDLPLLANGGAAILLKPISK